MWHFLIFRSSPTCRPGCFHQPLADPVAGLSSPGPGWLAGSGWGGRGWLAALCPAAGVLEQHPLLMGRKGLSVVWALSSPARRSPAQPLGPAAPRTGEKNLGEFRSENRRLLMSGQIFGTWLPPSGVTPAISLSAQAPAAPPSLLTPELTPPLLLAGLFFIFLEDFSRSGQCGNGKQPQK